METVAAKIFAGPADRPLELQNEINFWAHHESVHPDHLAVAITATNDGRLIALVCYSKISPSR